VILQLLFALLMTGEAPPLADHLMPYQGIPVLSIDIEAPSDIQSSDILPLIDIHPGYLLNASDVQNALHRLYGLGRFAAIQVFAEPAGSAIMLHFALTPFRRISDIEIDEASSAQEVAIRTAWKSIAGEEYGKHTDEALQRDARTALASIGYPNAKLTLVETSDPEQSQVELLLTVDEGAPLVIRSLQCSGQTRVLPGVLLPLIDSQPGDVVSVAQLERDRQRLLKAYISRGFLSAKVGEAVVKREGDHADITFPVEAGDRIDIEFTGNVMFTDEMLHWFWPNKTGQLGDGDLQRFVSGIREGAKLMYDGPNVR
jgi:outer membrane protein insertion porin family